MSDHRTPEPRRSGDPIAALARDIAEDRTGMPAYLVDDETWAAALAEAEATFREAELESPLAEAVRKARRIDPVAFINAYNEARRRAR